MGLFGVPALRAKGSQCLGLVSGFGIVGSRNHQFSEVRTWVNSRP